MKIGQLYTSDCLYSFRTKAGGVIIEPDDVVMITNIEELLYGSFRFNSTAVYFLHTAWNSNEAKVHWLEHRIFQKYFTKAKKRVV